MRRLKAAAAAAAATIALVSSPAPAQDSAPDRAAAFRSLSACRTETDDARRLACFDAAAARLDEAERAGEVVVLDREQVRRAKRDAFGFTLPSFNLFDRTERQRAEEVNRISLVLASAYRTPEGRWVLRMNNGHVWRQVDDQRMARARPGDPVEIRRAALGSFFLNVAGQRAIRASRER